LTLFFLSASAKVEQSKNITVGDKTRSYILYVPDNVAANPSLVFSLHGASGHSTDKSPFRTSVADSKGCIVVYPQGETQYFAVFGGSTTGWAAYGEANEDLDFFKAIIEDVAKAYPSLDRNRIYCTGFSNGGMMTYSNSQTASDIFAAFASISGYPINEMHLRHSGLRPIPFLHIHGKADDFVKYSLMGTIRDNMVARNGCNPIPTVTSGAGYTKSVYAAAGGGFPYIYYEVDGMGHNDYTDKTEDGNSSLTMWNFLSQYTLADACDKTLKWSQNPDQDGYQATEHGWQVTNRKRYVYGDATPTQNVSHSLQFEAGSHQLRIETTGTMGNTMTVKLATTDGKQVFCKQVPVGKKAYIPFSTTEYSEYTLTITKQSALDTFVSLSVYDTSAAWAGAEAITSADVAEQLKTETKTIELTQTDSSADKCSMTKESDGTTTFKTLSGGVEVVYKMLNVDVSGYDRVVVTFAAATPVELLAAFGSNQPTLSTGTTSYTYDIPSGTSTLSEIALIALWKGTGTTIKVKSVVLERDVVVEDADAVNDEMFSLKEGDFNPNIWETGKYSYDATKGVGTFYPGQYGFGGWHSKDGYDVSQYKTITVTFDEAPSNGVSFRIFDIDNYWTKEEDGHLWMTNCDGKYSVSMDISSIDRLYYVGFWAYGNAGGNYTKAMKIKSVTLTPKDVIVGDINCDGKVNIVDLVHLINILYTSSATNTAIMDINKDGSVDKRDIDALVELLY